MYLLENNLYAIMQFYIASTNCKKTKKPKKKTKELKCNVINVKKIKNHLLITRYIRRIIIIKLNTQCYT